MWDNEGMWRPEDYNLHYQYDKISEEPSQEEKIQFIDNLFNAILERANSRANFSDLRAEIVDHYISELGEKMDIASGERFKKEVYQIHEKFGGASRIVDIATNFFNTKNRMVKRQFYKWMSEKWYIHLSYTVMACIVFFKMSFITIYISTISAVLVIAIFEGYQYLHYKQLIRHSKKRDSSINLYFNWKLQVLLILFLPFNLLSVFNLTGIEGLLKMILLIGSYLIIWVWYYHHAICSKRITPILNQYKAQMI